MTQDTLTAVDILRQARALIADPNCWVQGDYALDEHGISVDGDNPKAVRWCAAGAVHRFSGHLVFKDAVAESAFRALNLAAPPHGIVTLNDEEDHAAVLAAYDRAIAALEAGATL